MRVETNLHPPSSTVIKSYFKVSNAQQYKSQLFFFCTACFMTVIVFYFRTFSLDFYCLYYPIAIKTTEFMPPPIRDHQHSWVAVGTEEIDVLIRMLLSAG